MRAAGDFPHPPEPEDRFSPPRGGAGLPDVLASDGCFWGSKAYAQGHQKSAVFRWSAAARFGPPDDPLQPSCAKGQFHRRSLAVPRGQHAAPIYDPPFQAISHHHR